MIAPWVDEELRTTDHLEKRLQDRLKVIVTDFSAKPTASIPAASGGFNEMTAAYRFFDNEKVTFEKVLAPHHDATLRRMAEHPVVLMPQDTTELELTRPAQQVVGAGPLDGSSRVGAFLHLLHAFTPDGTPLGTVWAEPWMRDPDEADKSAEQKRKERRAAPIEDKESQRWLDGLRQARAAAEQSPNTHCIMLADSEADIYELLMEPRNQTGHFDWIVRACQDRALSRANAADENTAKLLVAEVMRQPLLYSNVIEVRQREAKVSCEERSRKKSRSAREATVEVRAAKVTLRPPPRSDRKLPEATVNVVLVREMNPPEGCEPIEWLLLTTLSIDTLEQVRQIVSYYEIRWMIEIFNRTLKSGCRVEERLFEHMDRLLPCLAVYMIVAWRTLFVCRMGRSCPDMSCDAIFEPCEWQAVYAVVKRQPLPKKPPTLAEMVRLIAQLGGYINRKRDDPPGPQTVWLGLQRMYDLALAWQTFGPAAKRAHETV
jgi:hypothetical protein